MRTYNPLLENNKNQWLSFFFFLIQEVLHTLAEQEKVNLGNWYTQCR